VLRSTAAADPRSRYTEFVASEFYGTAGKPQLSELALEKAVKGPEPSWEIYSRLLDVYMARNDLRAPKR